MQEQEIVRELLNKKGEMAVNQIYAALMRIFERYREDEDSTGFTAKNRKGPILKGFARKFETQRKNIGKAHAISSTIRETSKAGIAAVKKGDRNFADIALSKMVADYETLLALDIPSDLQWQFLSEAGQEYVEFAMVKLLYSLIFTDVDDVDNEILVVLPDPDQLMVSPQVYLAGIGDAATELSKLLDDYILTHPTSRATRRIMRQRYVDAATQIYNALDSFETVYPQVINSNRRKGYGNTYRGLLGRIRGAINRQQQRLLDDIEREPDKMAV